VSCRFSLVGGAWDC